MTNSTNRRYRVSARARAEFSHGALIACGLLLFSGLAKAQGVVVHEDLPYKSGSGLSEYERTRCLLDLYLPEGVSEYPVIVWFHGGNLTAGDKASQAGIARSLAERGVAVAAVNYRLSPEVSFPAYVVDAAASVAWTLDNIADYGGDADEVFVSGHSAGGYLVAMLGLDQAYLEAHGHETAKLAGLIPISGQMVTHATVRGERGLPTSRPIVDAAAPVNHVSPDAPPVLAIAGSEDLPARPEENSYFIAAMKSVSHPDATYIEFAGRDHGSIVSGIPNDGDAVADAIVSFVREHSGQ